MGKKGFLIAFLVLFIYTAGHAQVKYADRLFEENSIEDAAVLYERAYKKDTSDLHVIQRLGLCYKKLNRYDEAEQFFAKAVKYPNSEPESHLYYGQLLKNQNKIRQARNQFEEYLKHNPESFIGKLLIQSCDAIGEWTSEPTEFHLNSLKAVNTEFIDMAPFPMDGKLMFTSDKNYLKNGDGKVDKSLDGWAFNIYVYDSTNNESPISSFSDDINTEKDIEGPAYINKNFDRIYYTKVFDRQSRLVNQIEIHVAAKKDDKWTKDESFKINNKAYSVANPVISPDESMLFFASDMPGGQGGFDIYFAIKTENEFSKPVNIGSVVNTAGDEIPTFFDENGNLYFSSSFHPGFGGMDIFKTSRSGDNWMVPENLKAPFNSTKDDLGFVMIDSISGYFASNRDGGAGLDDIFHFEKHYFTDSAFYTDISGIFLFDNLPLINKSLALMDENDEILQMVVTNEKGEFTFKNVASNIQYKILIDEEPDDIPEEARIYLTNGSFDKIMLIERIQKGLFKFKALPRDNYNGLSLMDEVDEDGFPLISVAGQLSSENPETVISQKRIYVIDESGTIIASTLSDHLGKFEFEKLSVDDQYLFRLEEEDATIDIQILNAKGDIIGRTVKNKDGIYVYHKFTINPSSSPDIRGLFKFGNLPADGVMLMLLNEDDDVVMMTTTNVKGEFEFAGLEAGARYKIQVDTNINVPGNSALFLMDKHTGTMMPVSKLANGTFRFETLAPIPAEELALMAEEDYVIKPRHNLFAQVYSTENKTIPADLEVQLVDANGKVNGAAKTDKKGIFKFFNLPVEDEYLFNIPQDDPSYAIRVINGNNDMLGEAERNDKNQFAYHKFTINPSKRPDIRGVFKYGNLPANDVSLNLLNENDDVLQVSVTNAQGEFAFKQLYAGKSYRIQVDESEKDLPDNANMFIVDEYTGLLLPVSKLNNGTFKFETLAPIEAEDLTLVEEKDESVVRYSFFAQMFTKAPKDIPPGTEVLIVDSKGTIIATSVIDKNGRFKFEKLPLQDEYLMKISEDDPNFGLKIISEDGDLVGELKRNSEGNFIFNRNELYKEVAQVDKEKIEQKKNTGTTDNSNSGTNQGTSISKEYKPLVNFGFDGYDLNDDSKKNLNYLADYMKKNQSVKLDINSHTDSRGEATYNMWLSQKRADAVKSYLTENGIDANRIKTNSYGETKLLNECADGVECPMSKHAVNRRVELSYQK